MAAETIKDFLVSLGYSVDSQSEQKFKSSLRGAVVQANLMSEALIGTAKAVFEAVAKISQSFDSLYWTSQRTGDSVENIRALSYAVSQLGGTYEGARTAIEAFGQHLRSNPGYASMLRALGVKTDENGKMRDQVVILQDLGKTLSKMPYYQALQYAGALGIDENTMRALMSGDLVKQMQKYRDIQKGVGLDSDKAAESSRKLMAALAETQAHIEAVATKILTDLQPQITEMLTAISAWFVAHKDDIKQILTDLIGAVTDLVNGFKNLVNELEPVWQGFQKIAESVTGKDGLKAAFEAFAIYVTGAWILGILGAFGKFKLGWALLLGGGAWLYNNSSVEQGAERGERWNKAIEGTGAWKLWSKVRDKVRGALGLETNGRPEGGVNTSGDRMKLATESYRFWRSKGYSHEQSLGMVANEDVESAGFNIHAVGDGGQAGGSFQWHPDRRAAIKRATGIDVYSKDATHLDMLNAAHWELQNTEKRADRAIRAANDAYEAGSAFSQTFERPRDVYGQADARGKKAMAWGRHLKPSDFLIGPTLPPGGVTNSATMNQATNITVNGATDPSTTAQMIQDKQNGVNSVLLRNMQGWAR